MDVDRSAYEAAQKKLSNARKTEKRRSEQLTKAGLANVGPEVMKQRVEDWEESVKGVQDALKEVEVELAKLGVDVRNTVKQFPGM